jgi:non-specific serine/threonine protein kinase
VVRQSKIIDDLWSQMQFINPIFWELCFAEHYKVPIEKNKTKTVCWTQNLSQSVYFTSNKEQVLKDLPNSEQVFYCDMEPEQEKLYEEEKSKARNAL